MFEASLAVALPTDPPFERPEPQPGNWYDSFLGSVVLPVYETGKLDRFWFSHYGEFGKDHHAKFRFSTEHFQDVQNALDPLIARFNLTLLKEHEHTYPHPFDILGDLVPPGDKAHFGDNQRHTDRRERADRLYDFLHASAELTLHCLSHHDGEGRWDREDNPDRGNNHFGDTTESIHHLFCNLSGVPTAVCVVPVAGQIGPPFSLVSPLYAKILGTYSGMAPVIPVKF